MSLVELAGRRYLVARAARVTGDASWWVFVVGVLIAEIYSFGLPRRYADYEESIFGVGLGQSDFGWTAYQPLTDQPSPVIDFFYSANAVASAAAFALVLTMIAAVVEAVAVGRWPVGVAGILAPVAGAGIILATLHYRHGLDLWLNLTVVFVLVLVGVAVREVWVRGWAPRPQRAISPDPGDG
ncbi:hypothetical protein AWC04_12770 [Mycolicibacterium fallax]|uniref:Uncharacterized protein n=1 Tax=Mycolicibacterium fallax TaxID=1793 RepID=A0A1X1R946_MYCFA|nr:hypothetical protein AWC04_12770 [Mycolicibacterium fallax]BBY98201.1 hypothetical protein MFAL_16680 [Mycolicibacterium fallax]